MRREEFKTRVLKVLQSNESYGYEIARILKQERGSIHTGYLYGVLGEMEREGLIQSEWKKSESGGPPRKIHKITPLGSQSLEVGLLTKAKPGSSRAFPQLRTAALLALSAVVLTDLLQFYLLRTPPEIGPLLGAGIIVFAGTIIFLNLRGTGSWVGWTIAISSFLVGISVLLPPHPTHTWQAIFGLILAVAGVMKFSLSLTLIGFTLMVGIFILHEFFLTIDPGPIHDVYTSTTWLVLLAGGLGLNALYLYLGRGRMATLSELFSFGKTPSLSEMDVSEDSRLIKAPREQVWNLLADMVNWPKWFYGDGAFRVLSHDVVSTEGNVVICDEIAEVRGKKRWSRDKYTLHPQEGIEETYLEGPLRGRLLFTLQDVPDGTRVTLKSEIHRTDLEGSAPR